MNYTSLDSYKVFISPSETVLFYSEENNEIEEFNELISSKENYVKDVDKNIITSFTTMLKHINSFYNPDTFVKITYPVYYINMDKNPDRKEFMETQLKKYTTSFTRIRGFNGYGITNLKKDTVDNIEFTCDYDNMSKGEIGCTMSHLLSIKKAYDNGNEYALVVEDDILLNLLPILDVTIKELVENAPNDWEILQLNTCEPKMIIELYNRYSTGELWSKWKNNSSTMSYIINEKGMKTIIDTCIQFYNNKIVYNLLCNKQIMADIFFYKLVNTYISTFPLFNYYISTSSINDQNAISQKTSNEIINNIYSNICYVNL